MQQPRHAQEGPPLAERRARQDRVVARPAMRACSSNQPASTSWSCSTPIESCSRFHSDGRAAILAAHGVLDLGRVAQPAHAPSQRVEQLGPIPVADAG